MIVPSPGYSNLISSSLLPELEYMLYKPHELYIEKTLNEIARKQGERNTDIPGAQYFYFQGKFYMSSEYRMYYATSKMRPTHTLHHSLVPDMLKLLDVINDTTIAIEKAEVFVQLRSLCRKAKNYTVLKLTLGQTFHTEILQSISESDPSEEEVALADDLKDKYASLFDTMMRRKTINLLFT